MTTARALRTMAWTAGLVLAAGILAPDSALAQGNGKAKGRKVTSRGGSVDVPPGHLPPAGQCRVWVQGTPPGQQAEPTDCETAMRTAATMQSARVVYGRGDLKRGGPVTCGDTRTTYPTTAPRMTWGLPQGGISDATLRRYGIRRGLRPSANDFNNDGTPETITWFDGDQVVQIWHNPDGDANANLVEVWCNGQRVNQFAY